jgi:signal transduction histidine kinase
MGPAGSLDGTLSTHLEQGESFKWVYDLYRIGQSAARLSPAQVQRHILDHLIRGFAASSGALATANPDGETLTIVAAVNLPPTATGAVVRMGERIMGRVAQSRRPLLLNGDLSADPRLGEGRTFPNRPASALCWPLVSDDRVVGAVSINRSADEAPFSEHDLADGQLMVNVISVAVENARLHEDQRRRIEELARLNHDLSESTRMLDEAQAHLLQSEKLASIGQLAAGVAHEINNPVGYVNSNLTSMRDYVGRLFGLIDAYEAAEPALARPEALAEVRRHKEAAGLDFLRQDLRDLLDECEEGLTRVKRIVQDLKDFAHADDGEWEQADLHKGLDSTLNIVHNELKYKAEVVKEYGELPAVECIPSQLNQVFMNLLVNAAHAIPERGTITVRTGARGERVWVEVADTGVGIDPEHLGRLFDPFFTTKPVGEGTGLGLALAYGIVHRHGGRIGVDSQPGAGTTFRVTLPVRHAAAPAEAA